MKNFNFVNFPKIGEKMKIFFFYQKSNNEQRVRNSVIENRISILLHLFNRY